VEPAIYKRCHLEEVVDSVAEQLDEAAEAAELVPPCEAVEPSREAHRARWREPADVATHT
jgi:hypothetical protein